MKSGTSTCVGRTRRDTRSKSLLTRTISTSIFKMTAGVIARRVNEYQYGPTDQLAPPGFSPGGVSGGFPPPVDVPVRPPPLTPHPPPPPERHAPDPPRQHHLPARHDNPLSRRAPV